VNSPVSQDIGCEQLHVLLHRHGLRGLLSSSCEARCIEFNLDYMRVETDRKFDPGDRVVVDLSLIDVCMEEVEGAIFEVEQGSDLAYCYRVEFLYRNSRRTQSAEIVQCLRLIEDHIKHAIA
jgi:hypothetical protein